MIDLFGTAEKITYVSFTQLELRAISGVSSLYTLIRPRRVILDDNRLYCRDLIGLDRPIVFIIV